MIEALTLPFQFPFMQKALLVALMISVPTAMLSCFLVLKGWALMGDAVSHAVLPGIVLAYVAGVPLIVGAFAAGMLTSLATGWLSENSRVKRDTVMGVVFSGMFGLGIVLYVWIEPAVHLDHILFGNLLGVGADDIWTAAVVSALVGVWLLIRRKDLMLQAFDPVQAKASGLSVRILHYGLLVALSLTIVATLSATGMILAVGLLIAPGAIAFLLTRRFGQMMWVSVLICMVAQLAGIYLSFYLDAAPAPSIIVVLTVIFLAAFGYRMWRNHKVTATS